MKLEVGKKYVTRGAGIVTIDRYDPGAIIGKYKGSVDGYRVSYHENGRYYEYVTDKHDCIKEYIEKDTLKLEVGKKYKTRGSGRIVLINVNHDRATYPDYEFRGEDIVHPEWTTVYPENGRYFAGDDEDEDEDDLVEEYFEECPTSDTPTPTPSAPTIELTVKQHIEQLELLTGKKVTLS